MNINRDYLIVLDVKSGEVDSPNIYYFNTDKNTSNLYVQMVMRETTVDVNPIENAADYSIKANILKPNLVAKEVEGTLVNPGKAIYEFTLPADCTDFSGNAKIEFEVYTGNKIATSFATKFKVHGSVLTEQNKYIEDSSDYPILKELMAEVVEINKTANELDTTIRTLQADMIEANNEMKTNEATRQANEVAREANEAARKEAERTRANQEAAREEAEATRDGQEATRVANEDERKAAENQRKANEEVRSTNEVERKANEASRVSTENTRSANEEVRQTNEANREVAEQIRRTNEEARITEHEAMRTEHEQTMTAVNEVKAENAVLMENDKKIADRMTQVEISDKRQYVIMEGLMNSAGDGYLKIEDTGNDTTLYNSVEGFVDVKNITGNTMVNSIKNPDDEFTLNGDINTAGQSVTLTTATDGGQVDVLAEGNTMVNVCDQQEAVAITTDTNTFPLRYLYTSTEYTLQFESDTAVTIDITLGGYTLSSQNIVIGLNKINIITPNELTDNNLILNGMGFSASNIVVTEATDKDFGYFAGMKSVGELEENKIEILSSNKNLVDWSTRKSYLIRDVDIVQNDDNGFIFRATAWNVGIILYVDIKYFYKNSYYKLSTSLPDGADRLCPLSDILYLDNDKNVLGKVNFNSGIIYTNNIPANTKYIRLFFKNYTNDGAMTNGIASVQIEKVSDSSGTNTDYIPHAENKKQILLNEPLRAVGDTKDRFVQIDGKWYVERNCGELVFDGSEDEEWDVSPSDWSLPNSIVFAIVFPNSKGYDWGKYDGTECLCDKIPSYSDSYLYGNDVFGFTNDNIGAYKRFRIPKSYLSSETFLAFRQWLQSNPVTVVYELASPTYEPVEISPVLNTYTDVTHITNNSTIPMNMPIVNSGYELIAKPSTKYTVVGITNGRIGDSTIVNGTITTPATLDDPFLRPYGTGKTSKVMLLEGEPANIPGYFKGIKSVFEDKVTEDGKYACKVRVYNDLGNETVQTLYLDEPLYNTNNITIYNDKLGYWKNYDIRDYQDGDFGTYLTDMTKTVYQLAEPVFVPVIDNCPNFVIGSWDNCSIHFDSIIPLLATRYRYTGNVPSVVAMSDDIDTVSSISDEQDALLIDMATELAVIKLTM